jgi:hypothetical protein
MAVEVTVSKRLHRHALPISLVLLSLIVVTIIGVRALSPSEQVSNRQIGHALVSPVFHQSARRGVAQVRNTAADNTSSLGNASAAGSIATQEFKNK